MAKYEYTAEQNKWLIENAPLFVWKRLAEEFEKVILYLEKTASKESVKVLSSYLEELNKDTENGSLPAVNIVSAVIQALGNLGDKSAFDCLLFTTYLNYPEDIVAQARRALSSLKW